VSPRSRTSGLPGAPHLAGISLSTQLFIVSSEVDMSSVSPTLSLLAALTLAAPSVSAQDVTLSVGNVNLSTGTVEIMFSNTVAVAGFQFDVSEVTIDNICCGATEAANFDVSWNPLNGRVLCFGFGTTIPPGPERLLLELSVHCDAGACDNSSAVCLSAEIFSDPAANALTTSVDPCGEFYSAFCFGDGSGLTCPCGNNGASGEGCANSSGSGATLTPSGSNDVALDDINFLVTQGPPGIPGILFTGTAQAGGGSGILFGDGLLCASGTIQRLDVKFLDNTGSATWGPGLQPDGGWSPGDTRHFQAWYRDTVGPCNGGFNTSHGVTIQFYP
jgi:hypothetical protein